MFPIFEKLCEPRKSSPLLCSEIGIDDCEGEEDVSAKPRDIVLRNIFPPSWTILGPVGEVTGSKVLTPLSILVGQCFIR